MRNFVASVDTTTPNSVVAGDEVKPGELLVMESIHVGRKGQVFLIVPDSYHGRSAVLLSDPTVACCPIGPSWEFRRPSRGFKITLEVQ